MSLEGAHLRFLIYWLYGNILVVALTLNFFRMHGDRIPAKQSSRVSHVEGWAGEACPPPPSQIAGMFHQKYGRGLLWTCPPQYSTHGRAPQHTQISCNIQPLLSPGHRGGTSLPTPLWSMSPACRSKTYTVNVGWMPNRYIGNIQLVEECSGKSYINMFFGGEICPVWSYLCCWLACAARRPDGASSSASCNILRPKIMCHLEYFSILIARQYNIFHMCNPPIMCWTNSTV